MSFLDKLKDQFNVTTTENGAKTYVSTKSKILDMFSTCGTARKISENDIKRFVIQAMDEDPVLATKAIFYLVDIREGQGERRFFRIALPIVMSYFNPLQVISCVPHFSRWDLVVELFNEYEAAREFIRYGIENDDALLFKWLPSYRSSGVYNQLAKDIAKYLGLTISQYRVMLKQGRKKLNLVETNLTEKNYAAIDYNKVPSVAGLKYREAFKRNDGERYNAHVLEAKTQAKKVASGEMKASEVTVKVNANVLYPHEIISKYTRGSFGESFNASYDESIEALWYSQKDHLKGLDTSSVLTVIDTSGSMGQKISVQSNIMAIDVALGFGVYFAERLNGPYKNHFINFSDEPHMQKLAGNSLHSKLTSINYHDVNYSNTNIQAVFDLVLRTAIDNKLKQEELPSTIMIISDMEFDSCSYGFTNLELAKRKFKSSGYELPDLVFWRVDARNENVPASMNDKGVALVSGYSPSVIKFILTGEYSTPYELMLNVLNSPRYSIVESFKKL